MLTGFDWVQGNLDQATCAPFIKTDADDAIRRMRALGIPDLEIGVALAYYAFGNGACAGHDDLHAPRSEWWPSEDYPWRVD